MTFGKLNIYKRNFYKKRKVPALMCKEIKNKPKRIIIKLNQLNKYYSKKYLMKKPRKK